MSSLGSAGGGGYLGGIGDFIDGMGGSPGNAGQWDISSIRTSPMQPANSNVIFSVGEPRVEMLKLCENGDIYVKGKLIKNDIEVVVAMRELCALSGVMKQDLRYHTKQAIDGGQQDVK